MDVSFIRIGIESYRNRYIVDCCGLIYRNFDKFVTWTLIILTSSISIIIVSMFFYGLASSILVTMGNIYFGEVSSPRNREILGVCYPVMSVLGSQIEFLLTSLGQYRLLVLFPLVMCIFALVSWIFMLETPCYLVSANRHEEAIKNLRWFNDKAEDESVDEMYDSIMRYVDERKSKGSTKLKVIFLPDNFRLIISMIVIQCAATINCRTIVMLYGAVLVKAFPNVIEGRVFVNLYSAALTISTIVGFPVVTRCRRKSLLVFGFLVTGVIQAVCASFYFLEDRYENKLEFLAVVIVTLLIIHGFISTCTYSPTVSVLKGEVFPYSVKEICGSIMSLTNDCAAFVTAKFYFGLASTLGLPLLFLFYTFFTSAGLLAVYYNISDTKGKTLHQIRSDYTCETGGKQLHHLQNKYKIVKTRPEV